MLVISYKIIGVVGWTPLFNDATGNQSMEKFAVNGKNITSVIPGFGAAIQSIVPMGNRVVNLNWMFNFVFNTAAAATLAMLNLDNAIDGVGIHFQVQVGSTTPSTFYFPNVSIDGFDYDIQGVSATLTLQSKCQGLTVVQPTT